MPAARVPFTSVMSRVAPVDGARTKLAGFIDPSWGQGRTVFGGIAAAVAVRAACAPLVDPAPPLRSLLVSFVGPTAPGEVTATGETLRAGKSVTTTAARLTQGDDVCVAMQASFGVNRSTTASHAPRAAGENGFAVPPKESIEPWERTHATRHVPAFLDQFEMRWETGKPFPPTPPNAQRLAMWLRHRDPEAHVAPEHRTSRMVAIADVSAPIIMTHYDAPVVGNSLSWSLEFVVPPEDVASEWFYLDYRLESAANGYTLQSGSIYDEAGRLVALSRQCMVYYEPKPPSK